MKIFSTKILLFAFLFVGTIKGLSQTSEVVDNGLFSAYKGKSYHFKKSVTLQSGFLVSAATHGPFFIKPLNENQPLSLDKNFVRVEQALEGTTSDGTFSNYAVDLNSL